MFLGFRCIRTKLIPRGGCGKTRFGAALRSSTAAISRSAVECVDHEAPFWFLNNPTGEVLWMIDHTRHPNPWIERETKTIRGTLAVTLLMILFWQSDIV